MAFADASCNAMPMNTGRCARCCNWVSAAAAAGDAAPPPAMTTGAFAAAMNTAATRISAAPGRGRSIGHPPKSDWRSRWAELLSPATNRPAVRGPQALPGRCPQRRQPHRHGSGVMTRRTHLAYEKSARDDRVPGMHVGRVGYVRPLAPRQQWGCSLCKFRQEAEQVRLRLAHCNDRIRPDTRAKPSALAPPMFSWRYASCRVPMVSQARITADGRLGPKITYMPTMAQESAGDTLRNCLLGHFRTSMRSNLLRSLSANTSIMNSASARVIGVESEAVAPYGRMMPFSAKKRVSSFITIAPSVVG